MSAYYTLSMMVIKYDAMAFFFPSQAGDDDVKLCDGSVRVMILCQK